MHYYKRHIGDYAKKAGHLSPLEHGVYNLIIDSYYDREQAPTLLEAMRWARARSEDEKAAVLAVLDEFFTVEGDRYIQNRIEDELICYHGKAETNRQIAIDREQAKRDRREQERTTPERRAKARTEHDSCTTGSPEMHDESTSGQPNHKPLTTNHKPTKRTASASPLPEWIPEQSWDAFMAMRRQIKKPVTPDAVPLAIAKLDRLRKAGSSPGDVLDQSTLNCWQGLFEVKPGQGSAPTPAAKDWI